MKKEEQMKKWVNISDYLQSSGQPAEMRKWLAVAVQLVVLCAMLWCRDLADDRSCLLDDIAFAVAVAPIDLFDIDTDVPKAVEWEPIAVVDIVDAVGAADAAAAADTPACTKNKT